MGVALVVIAKAPEADGANKRLCPPCLFEEAAALGGAALADTLEAVDATRVRGPRVLVLDGVGRRYRAAARCGSGGTTLARAPEPSRVADTCECTSLGDFH